MVGTRAGDGTSDGRGVSEVISVVLMVAVTIVLAAMVGTVLLNIVSDVETGPVAGTSISVDAETNEITVTYVDNKESGTEVEVVVTNESSGDHVSGSPATIKEVGNSATFPASGTLPDGTYVVKVIAKGPDGTKTVMKTIEITI